VARLSETDTQDEAPALPGDGLREGVIDALRADLGEQLIDTHLLPQDDLWVRVAPEAWAFAAQSLKAQGFQYFCFLSAMDWMPSPYGKGEDDHDAEQKEPDTEIRQGYAGGESRFQMLARLTDIERHVGVTLKADVPDSMVMQTWIPLFAGANWHERETHEMFGIGFDGHPDLRNLYLPSEFEGFPLRKDFPLLARMVKPWPGIVDVEPMPEFDEPDAPKAEDTAAGDAVEAATEPPVDAEAPPTDTDESAEATVADTPPTDNPAPPTADADAEATGEAIDAADAAPDAVEPDGEPATGPAADTIISDDTPSGGEATISEPDDRRPGADGTVEADLEPGTTTESTDADAEAPTPGPATSEHPDGLTGGDAEPPDRRDDPNDEEGAS
jgi:NADH-quinone oxidoreductase subunit C